MGFFDEIGTFFSKTIPNVVTKEIPKFVTETVPSVFERDTYAPDLPPLRAKVARMAKQAEADRERYFATVGRVKAKLNRYRMLSEDYSKARRGGHGAAIEVVFGPRDEETMLRELDGFEKTLNDIGQGARMVATVATLGLLELGLMHVDNANERKHLKEREAALGALLNRLGRAIGTLEREEAALDTAIASLETALTKAGLSESDAPASALREAEVAEAAKTDLAAKLLADGLSIEGVAAVTGLSPKIISGIAPDASDPLPETPAEELLFPDEIALLRK